MHIGIPSFAAIGNLPDWKVIKLVFGLVTGGDGVCVEWREVTTTQNFEYLKPCLPKCEQGKYKNDQTDQCDPKDLEDNVHPKMLAGRAQKVTKTMHVTEMSGNTGFCYDPKCPETMSPHMQENSKSTPCMGSCLCLEFYDSMKHRMVMNLQESPFNLDFYDSCRPRIG